jgi:hypothetical protein
VAAECKAWVCCCPLPEIAGSIPARGMGVCCHLDVSPLSQSLIQRTSTEAGVHECDPGASIIRKPWSIHSFLNFPFYPFSGTT